MDRVNKILEHRLYREYVHRNEKEEENRQFCRHGMTHFLDVARIAWHLNTEEHAGIDKELIYAAALLHDIGRHLQYTDGVPHEQAGVLLAPPILEECGFEKKETEVILSAIAAHRDESVSGRSSLDGILYRADKLSRPCYWCGKEADCNWKQEKKNMKLQY